MMYLINDNILVQPTIIRAVLYCIPFHTKNIFSQKMKMKDFNALGSS